MLYQPETWPMMCSRDSSICAVPMLSLSPWVCCEKTCIHAHDELLSREVRDWTKLGPVLSGLCPRLPPVRETDTNDGAEHSRILTARQGAGAKENSLPKWQRPSQHLLATASCVSLQDETPVHADCTRSPYLQLKQCLVEAIAFTQASMPPWTQACHR